MDKKSETKDATGRGFDWGAASPRRRGVADAVAAVALKVRENAEGFAARTKASKHLRFLCALCSVALFESLRWRGIPSTLAEGYFGRGRPHTWLICCGRIYDVTYTQFNPKGARVLVVPESDRRYEPIMYWSDVESLRRVAMLHESQNELLQLVVSKLQRCA